jgi:arylsulfatase A-like enzyme
MNCRRPNIVLTIADDQRYDTIGAMGNREILTPNLDRMVEMGTSFTRSCIPGSLTSGVCMPSRAQLHSGRTVFHTTHTITCPESGRIRDLESAQFKGGDALPTLGAILGESGYETCGVGKWHNGAASFERSFQKGKRVFYGGMGSHFCVENFDYVPDTSGEKKKREHVGHSTEMFTSGAQAFLQEREPEDERPFFLYCAFTAPHDPRQTFWRWHEMYRPENMELPPNFLPHHPFDNGWLYKRDECLAEHPRQENEVRYHLADYYAMISHMDDAIGRLHQTVWDCGYGKDTIFIHTADHGIAIGQHGLMGKQNLYDHSMRVPLLISGPGIEQGVLDDRLCYMQDLFPTILEMAGLPVPESCDFRHLFNGEKRESLAEVYMNLMRAVRTETHKLIEYRVGENRHTQLFDLSNDRWETRNLAEDIASTGQVETLRKDLHRLLREMDDPFQLF